LAVVENDYFVNAENSARTSNLASERILHIMCRTAITLLVSIEGSLVYSVSSIQFSKKIATSSRIETCVLIGLTYFAIILPGNAKLSVCFLPFVGLKTADGLDVSTVSDDCLLASPELSLRFYLMSVNHNVSALGIRPDLHVVEWCHLVLICVWLMRSPMGVFSCGEEKARCTGAVKLTIRAARSKCVRVEGWGDRQTCSECHGGRINRNVDQLCLFVIVNSHDRTVAWWCIPQLLVV
jgi:hypothetical protein